MILAHSEKEVWKAGKDAVLLPLIEQFRIPAGLAKPDEDFLKDTLDAAGFKAKLDQLVVVRLPESKLRVFAYGLGTKPTINQLRKAVAAGVKSGSSYCCKELAVDVAFEGVTESESAKAIAESAVMSSYRFDRFKKDRQLCTVELVIVSGVPQKSSAFVGPAIREGEILGNASLLAREIINTPAQTATPRHISQFARKIALQNKLRCTVLGTKEMEKLGMKGVLAVGSGSANESQFVVLEYNGIRPTKTIVLVGKGVTFDSGGLSLKPAMAMETMKEDKSGAAAVIATLEACAKLKLKQRVIGIMPLVENLPSGTAFKPGDIITTMSGQTVEILNTDAEGRVILADALHYAKRFKPDYVVDIATLTGACVVALGNSISGIMGTDDVLIKKLFAAGEKTGERLWQLPLYDEYEDLVKSDFADMRNVTSNVPGASSAGAIAGGMFLKKFADYPWAHLDIAGPAWSDGDKDYLSKGATGVGARLLTQFIIDLA